MEEELKKMYTKELDRIRAIITRPPTNIDKSIYYSIISKTRECDNRNMDALPIRVTRERTISIDIMPYHERRLRNLERHLRAKAFREMKYKRKIIFRP